MTDLAARMRALARAADDVRSIGLGPEADAAAETLDRARERIGFAGDVYVLALAGGTGVGKSSVLNALAGRTVSAVRAVRPTTDEPIAWVADDRRDELGPLLDWLGVGHVAGHADRSLSAVAILDLPDVDSVRTEHRARVDALLPRIDAVAWVVDPEKYDDERLHAYLRSLRHHAPRLRFILNKVDRLADADVTALEADLARRLAASGITGVPIDPVSATDGRGVAELRAALAAEADAKAVVAARLAADADAAIERLASALGIDADEGLRPLVPEAHVAEGARASIDGAVAVIDPVGLARQVQAAVLGRARRSGGSLLGRAVDLLGWLTGQRRRRADPAAYLRDWRRRGTLGRAVNPVRAVLVEAAAAVPPRSRPAVLAALGADDLDATLAQTLDVVARDAAADLHVPRSWLWPVVGALQLVVGAAFVFAAAWYVTLFLAGGAVPVSTVDAPVLGPIPLPLALLAGSVVVSAVLGWILALHAGWLGRRRGRRVAERVRDEVGAAVEAAGLGGLRRVEAVRAAVAASRSVE